MTTPQLAVLVFFVAVLALMILSQTDWMDGGPDAPA
jgi:hypothetical protein